MRGASRSSIGSRRNEAENCVAKDTFTVIARQLVSHKDDPTRMRSLPTRTVKPYWLTDNHRGVTVTSFRSQQQTPPC